MKHVPSHYIVCMSFVVFNIITIYNFFKYKLFTFRQIHSSFTLMLRFFV